MMIKCRGIVFNFVCTWWLQRHNTQYTHIYISMPVLLCYVIWRIRKKLKSLGTSTAMTIWWVNDKKHMVTFKKRRCGISVINLNYTYIRFNMTMVQHIGPYSYLYMSLCLSICYGANNYQRGHFLFLFELLYQIKWYLQL